MGAVEIDGRDDRNHPFKSLIIGGGGAYIPYPSHSFLTYLGPHVQMLLLDCRFVPAAPVHLHNSPYPSRAERKKTQVCSPHEYKAVFERMHALPRAVEHLVLQTGTLVGASLQSDLTLWVRHSCGLSSNGVPRNRTGLQAEPFSRSRAQRIARAVRFRQQVQRRRGAAGRLGTFVLVKIGEVSSDRPMCRMTTGLPSRTRSASKDMLPFLLFADAALVCSQKERNWLIQELQKYAFATHTRVSIVSGDVHCSAVGVLKTLVREKKRQDVPPPLDHRYMINVVTSTRLR